MLVVPQRDEGRVPSATQNRDAVSTQAVGVSTIREDARDQVFYLTRSAFLESSREARRAGKSVVTMNGIILNLNKMFRF